MYNQKFINLDQYKDAISKLRKPIAKSKDLENDFRYWTDFVMSEVSSLLGVIDSDLLVYTTLDSNLQEIASKTLRKNAGVYQGAVVAINKRGEITAMVGGTNYTESQFNRVLAMRQPGSTFKPVVYLLALENGMTPGSTVIDSEFGIGDYNPKNYKEKYYGEMTLADAFAKSANSVPLKLSYKWGLDNVLKMASRLGVGSKLRDDYSTVLGTSEMTLLDLTTMYATIWNNGYSMHSFAVTKIMTPTGKVLYSRRPSDPIKLLKEETVNYMTSLLRGVVENGTGRKAYAKGITIGGKTGTSSEYRDAWFVGATDRQTIGVWIGNDNFTPMKNVTGGSIPANVFREIVIAR